MSLMSSLNKFARSRQARQMLNSGMKYAQSPQGRARIAQLRDRVAGGRGKPRPR